MKNVRKCCIIGYLPEQDDSRFDDQNEDYYKLKVNLRSEMIELIENASVNYFVISMELGIGQIAAEAVLELRGIYTNIMLECVIPYETVANNWPSDKREKHFLIMELRDKETMMNTQYETDSVANCNRHLVKQSQFVIAIGNSDSMEVRDLIAQVVYLHKVISIIDLRNKNYTVGSRVLRYEMNS